MIKIILFCRIIPFVAADAVVEDKNLQPILIQEKHNSPTDNPLYRFTMNLFSPPIETEGKVIYNMLQFLTFFGKPVLMSYNRMFSTQFFNILLRQNFTCILPG